ncbi:hypothetical protein JYT90_00840 [bacterium AH-315-P07]|nr:hypothetical protein [bacterium AH-315-P07]
MDFSDEFCQDPACEILTPQEFDDYMDHLQDKEFGREIDEENAEQRSKRLAQLVPPTSPKTDPVYTKLGTPISPLWDEEWVAEVDTTEAELGHRCCGARVNEIYPCELEASNKNGRCRFHGGGLGSGAQKGNTNARIHGLYARRLQQCGGHCPHWNTCPFAGDDIKKLPEAKRPACTFEEQELDHLRTLDSRAHENFVALNDRSAQELNQKPYPMHAQLVSLRENLHMLQIMITRAANAMSIKQLTTESVQQSDTYYAKHEKPGALLQAHQMLTREHRLYLTLYNTFIKQWGLPKYERAA